MTSRQRWATRRDDDVKRAGLHRVDEVFSAVRGEDGKPIAFGFAGRPVGIERWEDGRPYLYETRYPVVLYSQGYVGDILAAIGEVVRVNRLGRGE